GHLELTAFARRIFPNIVNFHRFLYTYRDPLKEGLFLMYHPWESGRDNSPLWDASLERIEVAPDQIPAYTRRDLHAADASHRPTDAQYDRYVYLIEMGKAFQYDGQAILEESPFLIQDAMMNAILIKSNQSLINIGAKLGLDTGEIQEWQQQSLTSFHDKFWHEGLQTFVPYDFVLKEQIAHWEIGGLVPIFAGISTQHQVDATCVYLRHLHERGYYLCPSFDVDSPLFDSRRYWRGPVWPQMNWMLHKGLKAYGHHDLAELMKTDLLELVSKLGFFEYFESQKSLVKQIDQGYGGALFSWTASSVIDLIHTS
ncbi:MAG: trehalase family glycosidase, partial [Bacteroidota bacterium]